MYFPRILVSPGGGLERSFKCYISKLAVVIRLTNKFPLRYLVSFRQI